MTRPLQAATNTELRILNYHRHKDRHKSASRSNSWESANTFLTRTSSKWEWFLVCKLFPTEEVLQSVLRQSILALEGEKNMEKAEVQR